ncbi:MAG: acetoin utilization protein AcuC [Pseudomonadota bacterium]
MNRQPVFFGSEIYRNSSYGVDHPLKVPRVSSVMDLARALGWLHAGNYRQSPRAKPDALRIWHSPEYIAALQEAERQQVVTDEVRKRHGLGTRANPIYPEMFRRPATAAGASMLSAALLAKGGVIHHPGGGTHHGMPDRANGFCFLNDPVISILSLRQHGIRRVAYIDLDAHHPDGVAVAFRNDPEVILVSVHEENRWPGTGAIGDRGCGNFYNLPVPRGLHDDEMALIRDAMILPTIAQHRPEAIVLQCGADAISEDPLSHLTLSNNAHIAVLDALRPMALRLLVLGGGGYNPWSVARLWTRIWGHLNDEPAPVRLPPEAEAVLRGLSGKTFRQRHTPPESWFTTLVDPPRGGAIRSELRKRIKSLVG